MFAQRWLHALPRPFTTREHDAGYWWEVSMRQVEVSRTIVFDAPRRAAMAALGLFVAARFTEDNFTPARGHLWKASRSIFQRGITLARRDHQILLMLAATMLINGASMVTWLFPRQLVNLGFPDDPVLWYTALGIASFGAGAAALRIVEARIDGAGAAQRAYALACAIGVLGLAVLAVAPDALLGSVGVLLASGVAFNVTRAVGAIWVNRRTTSDLRATVHSFLSQAECTGKIISGSALAGLAQAAGITGVLITSAAIIAFTGAIVSRARADLTPVPASRPQT